MGDRTLRGRALPGRHLRRQLQPGDPERKLVGRRRAGQVVDAMAHPLEHGPVGRQARHRGARHPGPLRLAARDEAPLIGGELGQL